MRLGRDEVQDLSDGLLVRVVAEHHALQRVPGHLRADAVDDTLGVGLVHGDHLHFRGVRDVEEVLLLQSHPEGHFTRVAHQDDGDAERVDLLVGDGRKSRQAGRVLRGDSDASLRPATPPLSALSSVRGTPGSGAGTSAPARLADRQQERRHQEQGEGQREEGQGDPGVRTGLLGRRGQRERGRRWVAQRGWGGAEDAALVLEVGGRRVEADKHR